MTTALSVWFKAEILLARARLALKVDDAQLKVEAQMRKDMEKILLPILRDVIAGIVAAGHIPPTPGLATAPIAGAADDLAKAMEAGFAAAALPEMREITGNPTFSIDDYDNRVKTLLRDKAFDASTRTLSKLIGDVNATLAEGYASGLGIADIGKNLDKIFDGMKTYELERIARTEVNSAQNAIAAGTINDLRIELHQWIATLDDRVRESHEEIHGQIVRVGDLFSNGLEYPGDMSGPPEEFINCRCRIRPFILPAGMTAPPLDYFYEEDLVPAA